MPANKNAVTRYYVLDQLLANRYHNYTITDLMNSVNGHLSELGINPVSKRTIEYDIQYLEYDGPFLAEIERYTIYQESPKSHRALPKEYLRYADPSYSIFKKTLSDEESYLLSEALSFLGQFDGLPNLDTLNKLRNSLPVANKRQVISLTKNPLENSTLFGELFTVISQKQVIELHYHLFSAPDNIKKIQLYPYLLKEYNRRWFLLAASVVDNNILTFALDRIDKVVPLTSEVYNECPCDLMERFEDIVGITLYEDKPVEHILFWASDSSKDYILSKPIHESQILLSSKDEELRSQYPQLKGGKFFSIDCIKN